MPLTGNIADSPAYQNYRRQFEYIFQDAYFTHSSASDLSEKYRLEIHHYNHFYQASEKAGRSVNCQKVALLNQAGETIFQYKNLFGRPFWRYLQHSNTEEFFICGNDPEQYAVCNMTQKQAREYVSRCVLEPEKCTTHYWYVREVLYDPDTDLIAFNAQDVMNCPTATVGDWSRPDVLPIKMASLGPYLSKQYEDGYFCNALGWKDGNLLLEVGDEVSQTVVLPQEQIREILAKGG
jgi:hypothetical protein